MRKKVTAKVEAESFWEDCYRQYGAVKKKPLRKLDRSQNEARERVLAFVRALHETVLGRRLAVPVPGLGVFYPSVRKARDLRNVSGTTCHVPATVSVRFRPWRDAKRRC